ncbi:MAG TPA: DUF4397 domain-containing protein [Mucilaginibacter sp.]|jgi:hypothetical protein
MNTRFSVLFFLIVLTILLSCKNNDNVFPKVVSSYLNVVNASPDVLNFYLNGTRQNNTSSIFPAGQSFYITVPAGSQDYEFKKAGSSNIFFRIPLNLKDSVNNSLYVIDGSTASTYSTVDFLPPDTIATDTQIRFANVSPDAGPLDVFVGDTINFKSSAFKTSTVFLPTGSGQKKVKIYQTGAAIPKVDTTITFEPGRIYTLFSKGLINGKGPAAFGVGVVINY